MAVNPLKNTNRINQTKQDPANDITNSISLFDVDYAIMAYLQDVVLPPLDEEGKYVKMPVIYGNSERWNEARRNGIYRDQKGRIQLPIMMLRRTTVARNDSMTNYNNRNLSYKVINKWSKDNRYDRFGLANPHPKYEVYNITIPDYVEITYDCMGWTNYTEHLNTVIESLNWASDEYWGDKRRFKFITFVSDYNIINDVTSDNERINRVEFNLNVKAYLLPKKFDGENTTKKGFSTKAVVFMTETDLTGNGRLENLLLTPSKYYDNKDMADYLNISNTKTVKLTSGQAIFTGVKLIKAPGPLENIVINELSVNGIEYDVKTYQNLSTKLTQNTNFTVTYNQQAYTLTITDGSTPTLNENDDITIIGKFINV